MFNARVGSFIYMHSVKVVATSNSKIAWEAFCYHLGNSCIETSADKPLMSD